MLHPPGNADRYGLRLGLYNLWLAPSGAESPLWRQAGDNRGSTTSAMGLARTAIKNGFMTVVGLLAIVAALAGQNVLAILLGAGVATLSREWIKERYLSVNTLIVPIAVKIFDRLGFRVGSSEPRKPTESGRGLPEIWSGRFRKRLRLARFPAG